MKSEMRLEKTLKSLMKHLEERGCSSNYKRLPKR